MNKTEAMVIDTAFAFRNIQVTPGVYDYSNGRMKIGQLWYTIEGLSPDDWDPDIDSSVIKAHGHIEPVVKIRVKDHYTFDDSAEMFSGAWYLYIENGIGHLATATADDHKWHVGFDNSMIR